MVFWLGTLAWVGLPACGAIILAVSARGPAEDTRATTSLGFFNQLG